MNINYQNFLLIIIILSAFIPKIQSEEYLHILNDKNISNTYISAKTLIKSQKIVIQKEALGVNICFEIENPLNEYYNLSEETKNNLKNIEKFLAKNKNPVIIEVHTDKNNLPRGINLKNWELSTVISNNIEHYILSEFKNTNKINLLSIGYGEFLPQKNTSNNGGKFVNRVDIMVLCSINGE